MTILPPVSVRDAPAANFEQRAYCWITLALLGSTSGILTMTGPYLTGDGGYLATGGLFGLALATYFFLSNGNRSLLKGILFVIFSVVAYCLATWGAMASSLLFRSGTTEAPPSAMFVGGAIGAFLLLVLVQFLLQPVAPGKFIVKKAAIWSLAGGALGVLGWELGPSLGRFLWSLLPLRAWPGPDSFQQFSLYFVWQTGMALVVGFIDSADQRRGVASAEQRLPQNWTNNGAPQITRKAMVTLAIMLVALVVARAVPLRLRVAKREAGQARKRAEVPSTKNLPVIQPRTIDEALINNPIAGYAPQRPTQGWETPSNEKGYIRPQAMSYTVSYYPEDQIALPYRNSIVVSVEQYPNAQWASYLVEFPNNIYNPFDDPKVHAIVTRFGNKVRTDFYNRLPGIASGYYMWPSGNNVVTLHYYTHEEDQEFLRAYLEKYPSSIR